ncbi:GNAT family N-acetyltransferase [Paracoccus aerodenitrificans]|uniref:GNAT family N-acetyltransferase n=1 Tax=Paracoccus aerodenitrificans TaxID=3017781 RepID=UPI0022F0113A|nr:GNAT family protein [Paracoccus aerodenitrificans]WBU64409.1 GNAT family protein [Paracoccus aerodenitrificans]
MTDTDDPSSPGAELHDWTPPALPDPPDIRGRYVRLQRMDADRDTDAIFAATRDNPTLWDYMSIGPFDTASQLRDWIYTANRPDQIFYAFTAEGTDTPFGYAAFMRIDAPNGVLEIGHVMIGSDAQRSRASSEALTLMIDWAFSAGYRRVEWKCNALNAASRKAARRYGFTFEGIFRNHMIMKGRNRDTAWFSIIAAEWPGLSRAFADWLDPRNFDENGRQKLRLSELTHSALN